MKILNRFLPYKNQRMNVFKSELKKFRSMNDNRFSVSDEDLYPCLDDNTEYTGFDAHYVYHPAWATRVVKEINPTCHIDISSTLQFSANLSAFIPVKFYDYRPAKLNLSNLTSERIDLTGLDLEDNSIESLSCMHTIEHVGLGRYGDPIDPQGDITAVNELKRVVKPGGNLIFVTPVGKPKIMYNAHRIYSYEMVMEMMKGMNLKEFSMVYDDNKFVRNANREDVAKQNYACGCFWFQK